MILSASPEYNSARLQHRAAAILKVKLCYCYSKYSIIKKVIAKAMHPYSDLCPFIFIFPYFLPIIAAIASAAIIQSTMC